MTRRTHACVLRRDWSLGVWERRDGMGRDGHFLAITTATTTTVLLLLQISTETVEKDSSDILSKKEKKKTGGCRLFGSHL